MLTRTIRWLAAGAALLSVLAFAGAAQASCGSSVRVSIDDSECLRGWWSNSSWNVSNDCLHRVKIKIDIRNTSDKTRTMDAATEREVCHNVLMRYECYTVTTASSSTGSINAIWGRRIQSVTCCSDYGSCDHEDDDDD